MPDAPTGTDWTEREIDLIVADYFDMLALAGRGVRSSRRNVTPRYRRSPGAAAVPSSSSTTTSVPCWTGSA